MHKLLPILLLAFLPLTATAQPEVAEVNVDSIYMSYMDDDAKAIIQKHQALREQLERQQQERRKSQDWWWLRGRLYHSLSPKGQRLLVFAIVIALAIALWIYTKRLKKE